jgi:hypothetical protein
MSNTLAALPPDVRKACGLPENSLQNVHEKEKRDHPERHSLSAHQAAEPQNPAT